MKKQKLSNYLKTITLLLAITLLFFNCQDENLVVNDEVLTSQNNLLVKEYSFKEISLNTKFNSLFYKVSSKINQRKSSTSAKDNGTNPFTIDSTIIKEITINGVTTYTMLIQPDESEVGSFENLIIEIDSIDNTRAFIIKYKPKTNIKIFKAHNSFSFNGTREIEEIDFDSSIFSKSANMMTEVSCEWSVRCDYGGSDHAAGSKCTQTYLEITCNEGGGGGSGGTSSGSGSGTGSSGSGTGGPPSGGGSGSTSGGSSYTKPIITSTTLTPEEIAINNFFNNLNSEQQSIINPVFGQPQNSVIKKEISGFLKANYTDFLSEGETYPINQAALTAATKTIDILANLQDVSILSNVYERMTFTKLLGKILTRLNTSYFPEHSEAWGNINSGILLSLDDWGLITNKAFEVYQLYNPSNGILTNQDLAAQNSLFITMLPSIKSIVGEHWPQTSEQWGALGSILFQPSFLLEIGVGFIPGSSIIDVVSGIDNNDYVALTLGIAGLVVDAFGGTIIKAIGKVGKVAYKAFKIFKLAFKYFNEVKNSITLGFKTLLDGNTVKILNKSDDVLGKIVSNVLNVSFKGFGGDLISHPSKTTTVIGKFLKDLPNGTDALIKSGLTESITGISNKTTFNVLNDPNFLGWPSNKAWLDDAIKRGDIIRMISDPSIADGFFKQEIEHLISNGYKISGAYLVK